MDWRELKEIEIAKQARAMAGGDYGAAGDFSAFPDPPPPEPVMSEPADLRPEMVGVGALRPTPAAPEPPQLDNAWWSRPDPEAQRQQRAREDYSLDEIFKSPVKSALYGAATGIPAAVGHVGDTLAATPPGMAILYGAGKLLGTKTEGTFGDEAALGKTFLKPFSNLIPRLGGTIGEGPISEQETLQGQRGLMAGERLQTAMDPQASTGERVLSGALGTADLAALFSAGPRGMSTIPSTNFSPIHDAASAVMSGAGRVARAAEGAGFANPTVGQAFAGAGRAAQEILGIVKATPPGASSFAEAVRRGVINMPGKPRTTEAQWEFVERTAHKQMVQMTRGIKNDADKEAIYDAIRFKGFEQISKPEVIESDTVASMMKDAGTAAKRTLRGKELGEYDAPFREQAPKSSIQEPEDTLGLSDEAAREILAGGPQEAAVETPRASTYAPRGESQADRAARASRVEDMLLEGGDPEEFASAVAMMDKDSAIALAKRFGDPERNKGKAEAILKDAFAAQAKEPKLSVATPEGRREAAELQALEEAKKFADEPSAPKATEPDTTPPPAQEGAAGTPKSPTASPPTPRAPVEPPPGRSTPAPRPAASVTPPSRNNTGFADDHIDLLERASIRANNPAGRELAEKGREIVVYGESNAARPVKEINDLSARVLGNPKAREEVTGLVAPQAWQAAGAGDLRVGRFQANVDANAEIMGIAPDEVSFATKEAKDYADGYVKGMTETGREAERLGVVTPSGDPFVAKERRFIQQIDPSAYGWMKDGDPTFEKLKAQLSLVYPDADVKSIGDALKTMTSQPIDRPAAFEFERVIPMMPAAIVDDAGQLRPILRYYPVPTATNTSNPVAQILQSQWMRLGGIKHLGQDVTTALADSRVAADGALEGTKLGVALQEGGEDVVRAARGMLGAIYHRPEAGYTGTAAATWQINKSRDKFSQAFRAVTGRAVPVLNLSRQGIVSLPQTLGEVPAVTGAMNYAKAVAKVMMNPKAAPEAAEVAGAVQRKFLIAGSRVWDRHRFTESLIDQAANRFPTEKLNDLVKDLNDTIAFTAGDFKAEEMLRKGAKASDFLMMDEMNLPQSVQHVFRNPSAVDDAARAAAKQSFARAVAKETQFHAKNAALRGRFENDQALRWVMPYMSYSINTLKRTAKDFERVWRTAKEGWIEHGLNMAGVKYEPFRNALNRLSTRMLGMQAAGEAVADISSAGQGKDPLRSDRSALGRFLENLSYIGWLGPLHFAFDMASAHLLEGDERKRFEGARVGSRSPTLGNPTLEAAIDSAKKALKGDAMGALWEATAGQAPIVSNVGRATGLMEPSGAKRGLFQKATKQRGLFERKPPAKTKGLFDRPKQRGLFER